MSNDEERGLGSIFEAAVHDHISGLCRHAYVHELRSGLQALHSSIELLARSGGTAGENAVLARKASDIAKRAIATHEATLARVLDDLIVQKHDSQQLDLGSLARDSVQFIQNLAAASGVTLVLQAEEGIEIRACRQQLRTAILGVILGAISGMPQGSQLRLAAVRVGLAATLRFHGHRFDAAADNRDEWSVHDSVDIDALIVPVIRRMIAADGGRVSVDAGPDGADTLSITYPSS